MLVEEARSPRTGAPQLVHAARATASGVGAGVARTGRGHRRLVAVAPPEHTRSSSHLRGGAPRLVVGATEEVRLRRRVL